MNGQQLKNSILQLAVQGKLVPQDPNDEPASVLIQRIRAEKEKLIKEKKIKKEKNPSYIFRGSDNLHYEKIGDGEPVCIEDQIPFEIPDSWEWVRLGNVSTYAEKKSKINATEAPKDAWGLDLEDIEKGGRLLEKRTIGERKAVGDKTHFSKGDILYSKLRPYLLKILVAVDDGYCSPEIIPFSMFGGISHEFIVQYLRSPYVDNLINQITYGVKMPRVGTETMVALLCPIPPLAEQRRIVTKIEQILPYINEYESSELKIGQLNKEFPDKLKKSILQEAVQGKLVPQDPSDEPASILLERIREEKAKLIKEGKIKKDKNESVIFRRDNSYYEKSNGVERCIDAELPFEIPASWEWVRVGTMFQHNTGKALNSSNRIGKLLDYITTSNLYWDKFELNSLKQMFFTDSEIEKCIVTKGDLLVCEGGDVGRAAIWNYDYDICIQNHIHKLRAYVPVSTKFFFYLFYFYKKAGFIGGRGIGIQGLSSNALHSLLFPLPPMLEQKRIVEEIEKLFPLCNKLK